MRRALVLIAVFGAALLGTGLTVAAAAGDDVAARRVEEQKDVIFSLRAEGFTVEVIGEDNDGKQTAAMTVSRHGMLHGGLLAEYIAPATLSDHSLTAKFGTLGELNFEFVPRKCEGGLAFEGSFTFTGENEYIHIDADRAIGSFGEQAFTACGPLGPLDFSKIRRITSDVHLEATAGPSRRGVKRRVEAFEDRSDDGRATVKISAFRSERREGMTVGRGAIVGARHEAFRFNLDAGTATLRPPGPFVGSATLRPGRDGKKIWRGSLRVADIAGGPPIELAGSAFRARLREEQLTEE